MANKGEGLNTSELYVVCDAATVDCGNGYSWKCDNDMQSMELDPDSESVLDVSKHRVERAVTGWQVEGNCVQASLSTTEPSDKQANQILDDIRHASFSLAENSTMKPPSIKKNKRRTHETNVPNLRSSFSDQGHFEQTSFPEHSSASSDWTSVPLFYSGKGVLVTGVTGFIGKVLIEKLLRCCPELDCIYCLIRPKDNQTIQSRLDEITESKLFDQLRKERPDFTNQLLPVCGDMLLPDLGLSQTDCEMLRQKIQIVFHGAATVRFDEHLRVAMGLNVVGVQKMLALCRQFEHLEAFVHISTAFVGCDRSFIEETVYPPSREPQKVIDILEWMTDDQLELLTPTLLGTKPNTYTYTKMLAEYLLIEEGADLPLAIVRPSIVGAAWKEPFPGWIDAATGPCATYIAIGLGLIQSCRGDPDAVADIVPVDVSVNVMITVGWYTAVARPKNIFIYNTTCGHTNPLTWGQISDVVVTTFNQTPLEGCIRRPNNAIVRPRYRHRYWMISCHMVPAYICDVIFRLMGKKPRMVKLYHKINRSIETIKFFSLNEWHWTISNQDMLRNHLTQADMEMFYSDLRTIHWPTYIETYCLGAKKYVLKEDDSGLPAARTRMRKIKAVNYLMNAAVAVIFCSVVIAKFQFAHNLWLDIVELVW